MFLTPFNRYTYFLPTLKHCLAPELFSVTNLAPNIGINQLS